MAMHRYTVQTQLQKDNHDVDCHDLPSKSPDLNIIEMIWRLIEIRLPREQHTIHSNGDLIQPVTIIWYSISTVYIWYSISTVYISSLY